jgi:curved DNA-binding protein CbpA
MDRVNPYEVLGVHARADVLEIKAAYRRLARIHHPDHGGSREQMARINHAWSEISDPVRRRAVDERLERFGSRRASPGPGESRDADPGSDLGPIARRAARRAGPAASPTLNFGRYAGWTLARIAAADPDYLHWLARSPAGREYRVQIEAQLRGTPGA